MSEDKSNLRATAETESPSGVGVKVMRRAGIFRALLEYLWKEKMWWMIPMIVVLVGFTALAMIAGSSGIAPFVYTLF